MPRIHASRKSRRQRIIFAIDCQDAFFSSLLELKCLGEKFDVESTVACRPLVERLAKNDFQWTDGWLEPKFSHYRWGDKARGVVTYIGDKIKFQNGFGAWGYYTYQCDFDTRSKRVVDVRATPGRI
jgi:hypothetical protein